VKNIGAIMSKLLIIAIPFPLTKISGAAIRVEKFIKYLLRLGWEIVGLSSEWLMPLEGTKFMGVPIIKIQNPLKNLLASSVENNTSNYDTQTRQAVLFRGLIKSLKMIARHLIVPDDYFLWIIPATIQARKMIKNEYFDVILSMSPSASCHVVAYLAQFGNHRRWVADFRDPWIDNPMEPRKFFLSDIINRSLQGLVISKADVVVVNTEELAKKFMDRYPAQKDNIRIIYNGFDPEDFKDIKSSPPPIKPVILSHIGSFYRDRNPKILLESIVTLRSEYPDLDLGIQINFFGYRHKSQDWEQFILSMGLCEIIHLEPVIPHNKAIEKMVSSHVLLLIPGANYAIPGKVYEYMAANRPILVIGNEQTDVAQLIKNNRVGKVVSSQDGLVDVLYHLAKALNQDEINRALGYKPDQTTINSFRRDLQAEQLNAILHGVDSNIPKKS
jgi:glycosyltransferase involved in cell wall biosynthesis